MLEKWTRFEGNNPDSAIVKWHRLPAPIRARTLEVRMFDPVGSAPALMGGRGATLVVSACHTEAVAAGRQSCVWTAPPTFDVSSVYLAVEYSEGMARAAAQWLEQVRVLAPTALPCAGPANPAVLEKRTKVQGLVLSRQSWTGTLSALPPLPSPGEGEVLDWACTDLLGQGLVLVTLGGDEPGIPSAVSAAARLHGAAWRMRGKLVAAGSASASQTQAIVQELFLRGVHTRLPQAGGAARYRTSLPVHVVPYGPGGSAVVRFTVEVQQAAADTDWLFQILTAVEDLRVVKDAVSSAGLPAHVAMTRHMVTTDAGPTPAWVFAVDAVDGGDRSAARQWAAAVLARTRLRLGPAGATLDFHTGIFRGGAARVPLGAPPEQAYRVAVEAHGHGAGVLPGGKSLRVAAWPVVQTLYEGQVLAKADRPCTLPAALCSLDSTGDPATVLGVSLATYSDDPAEAGAICLYDLPPLPAGCGSGHPFSACEAAALLEGVALVAALPDKHLTLPANISGVDQAVGAPYV